MKVLLCSPTWVILLITMPMILGCTSTSVLPPAPGSVSREPAVTISFACLESTRSIYEPLVKTFESLHPDIHVQLVSWEEAVGDNLPWSVGAATRLAVATDTAVMLTGFSPSVTRQGLLRDLTPFLEADPSFEPREFWPGILDAYRWDGGTWAIPSEFHLWLLLYDRNALDASDLATPQPDWTRDEFLEMARALTLRQGDTVERYGFVDDYFMGLWGMVNAAWSKDDDDRPIPTLDDPSLTEQIQWYADLALRHGVMPRPDTKELATAAMWPVEVPFRDAGPRPDRFGLVPFPSASERGTPFSSSALVMSAGTTHPNAAWQWIAFLSQQPMMPSWGSEAAIPARRSTAEATDYWEDMPPEIATICQLALGNLRSTQLWDVTEPTEKAVTAILTEGAELNEALSRAQLQARMRLTPDSVGPTPTPLAVTGPPSSSQEDKTIIRFFVTGAPDRYTKAIESFESTHPDIQVKLAKAYELGREIQPGAITIMFSDLASGTDCFRWSPDTGDPAAVLDLEPLVDSDHSFALDDFYPSLLETFRAEGKLLGLPAEVYLEVLWYNRALFKAAEVPPPRPEWTLEQFLDTARTMTKEKGQSKQYGFVPLLGEGATFNYFATQMGAKRFDFSSYPPRPLFDSPDMARAVRWYSDLTLVHGVKPDLPASHLSASRWIDDLNNQKFLAELIRADRAAMWTGLTTYRDSSDFSPNDHGVVPLPLGPTGTYQPFAVEGYYISSSTIHVEACWEWITFLTQQEYLFSGLPARRSVLMSDVYRTRIGEEALAAYEQILSRSEARESTRSDERWSLANYWLLEAVQAVLDGQSVENALAQAQTYADGYVQCLERKDAADQDSAVERDPKECIQEVDPSLPMNGSP